MIADVIVFGFSLASTSPYFFVK